jgi:hypothetical protein
LDKEYKKHQCPPDRVFNVDVTGLATVQSKVVGVIARNGKRQIAALASAERGGLMTVIVAMSASGHFIPPQIIFPRKNMNNQQMRGSPPGAVGVVHPSGWVQAHIFAQWFMHFLEKLNHLRTLLRC